MAEHLNECAGQLSVVVLAHLSQCLNCQELVTQHQLRREGMGTRRERKEGGRGKEREEGREEKRKEKGGEHENQQGTNYTSIVCACSCKYMYMYTCRVYMYMYTVAYIF